MDPTVEPENFWSGWGERVSALRHVPPVLAIVWRSSPLVVGLGLVSRLLASTLPIALLWVAKLIIDSIVHKSSFGIEASLERKVDLRAARYELS